MTQFFPDRLLILGAGASAPFGYPLGPALITNIIKGVGSIPRTRPKMLSLNPEEINFIKSPYQALATFGAAHMRSENWPKFEDLHSLADNLHSSSYQSIDEFVRSNPSTRTLVKMLVALEIAKATYEPNPFDRGELKVRGSFFTNSRSTWYGQLVAKIRDNCETAEACYINPLNIITFNYDRSLEFYLERELSNAEIFRELDSARAVKVHHIHGAVDFDFKGTSVVAQKFGEHLVQCAGRFLMMGDEREAEQQRLQMIVRSVLDNAERIFVLGFDLHPQNVDLIGLGDYAAKTVVLNWNGTQRVSSRATRLGVRAENILNGTNQTPYEITSAVADGLFDRTAYLP